MLLLFTSFSMVSQQKNSVVDSTSTKQLDEVLLSATRTNRQLSSLPLPAQIITNNQIKQSGALRLSDILNEQIGLLTVPDFGGGVGIQMQGVDAQYTLIMIDGVPFIGRSAGTLDLNRISVNNIKQIEIVKGPSSSLYGSEAIGGVINIITENKKTEKLLGHASFRYGTFETKDSNFNFSFGSKKWCITSGLNTYMTNGYDLDESTSTKTVMPFYNLTPHLKFNYTFSEKLDLIISNRYFHQNSHVGYESSGQTYSGFAKTDEFNVHSRLFYKPTSKLNFIYEVYKTQYQTKEKTNSDLNGELISQSHYKEDLLRNELRSSISINNVTYTLGIGYNINTLDRTYFSEEASNNSLYGLFQYDYNVKDKWNILAGARIDKSEIYASAFSPKLAVNYFLNKYLSVKGSVGFGFKAPDLRQLYFDFENPAIGYIVLGYNVASQRLEELESQGRIDAHYVSSDFFSSKLQSEKSIGYNFGFQLNKNKLKSSVNAFYNSINNLIDTKVIARLTNLQNVFSYYNIGSVFTSGIEINSTYQLFENFQIAAGYQFLLAKDKDVIKRIDKGEIFARNPETLETFKLKATDYVGLFNRSKHTANFKTTWQIPSLKLNHSMRVTYRSKYGLLDTNNNSILDKYDVFAKDYFILDTSLSKVLSKNFEIMIGADNLLDFTDSQNASNISGRTIYGKIQFNF
ncbi:TonB-dependent receptor plug domain-containing protein [Flavobacterium terrae]|uniref:Outer membrane receptor for ferrienterochelin and colicins n=1 Tax=Flavobacterium terrae TaxID=415425 RepID=A0A1M6FUA1_9FLAO|nr:TonB-dependent receptor [Flavobacterium terrae]SHJ01230.1 outer membrane receptor for ferrienterochelin and colicins [Flavobacterium terrae]